MPDPLNSTRDFVEKLKEHNELRIIDKPIDPYLELAEIQRQNVAKKGPALLFTNVKNTSFPVATNLYGSESRIRIAFGVEPEDFIKNLVRLAHDMMPPTPKAIWNAKSVLWKALSVGVSNHSSGNSISSEIYPVDLSKLPQITSWPKDGGPFITLPLVHTVSPTTGKSNLGMYRIQLHEKNTTGMHIQIHRGGGFHYHEAEQSGKSLPCHIYVGGPPALTIAAVAPLPEGITEFLFASLLMGKRFPMIKNKSLSPIPLVRDADFTLVGEIPPHIRKPEGPFGDHYGYYALKHDYPVFHVKRLFHRKDAIWPATIVGRPPQEDHYIAEYLQDLLSPLFPLVMPMVKGIWAYEESGVHSLAAISVKERYHRESFMGALRVLGEGQLSLTKCLLVTDQDVILKNFRETFSEVVQRFNPATDLFIFSNVSQDTLDYTGPEVNKGSKTIWMGVGEKRNIILNPHPPQFSDKRILDSKIYIPGVLVIKTLPYVGNEKIAESLMELPWEGYQFVFLVDDASEAVSSDHDFIWHVFTRFEPAADIYSIREVKRNHLVHKSPIVIDSRKKPWYPEETIPLQETVERAKLYFE